MCSSFSLKTVKLANNLNLITVLQSSVLQTRLMAKMLLNFSGNRIGVFQPRSMFSSFQNGLRIGIIVFAMMFQPLGYMANQSTSVALPVKSKFSHLPMRISAVPGAPCAVTQTPRLPSSGDAAGGFPG